MSTIDCHAHAVPPTLVAQMETGSHGFRAVRDAEGAGWWVTTPSGARRRLFAPMVAAAPRKARMAEQGIEKQVLSPWLELLPPAELPAPEAAEWVDLVNDELCAFSTEFAADVPGVLAALCTHDVDGAVAQLGRLADRDDVLGVVLPTNPVGVDGLADPALEPVWQSAEAARLAVMIHPPTDGPSAAIPDSAEYGNTWCRLVDTTFAVSRLLLAGVLDRHPRLRLIVVHGGGFLPYQARRLDGGHRADALNGHPIERDKPSAYLSSLYYDTVALSEESVRHLVDVVGADRILLGTDYPFPLGDPDPVGTVLRSGVSPVVLGDNLRKLRRTP